MTFCSLILDCNVNGWYNAQMLDGIANNFLNHHFMIVYAVLYAYFLVMYFYLKLHPPAMYVLGVLLYTIGYAAFAVFFFFAYHGLTDSDLATFLNCVGSWCFFIGSVALVYATVPSSFCSKEVLLFYGSSFFLFGSVFFVFACSKV